MDLKIFQTHLFQNVKNVELKTSELEADLRLPCFQYHAQLIYEHVLKKKPDISLSQHIAIAVATVWFCWKYFSFDEDYFDFKTQDFFKSLSTHTHDDNASSPLLLLNPTLRMYFQAVSETSILKAERTVCSEVFAQHAPQYLLPSTMQITSSFINTTKTISLLPTNQSQIESDESVIFPQTTEDASVNFGRKPLDRANIHTKITKSKEKNLAQTKKKQMSLHGDNNQFIKCSVLTFNCCLAVCPPLRFNGAFARASRIADAVYSSISFSDLDVICLQEHVAQRESSLKAFIHHVYHTHKVESSLFGSNIRMLHAGLTTLSKWPILEEDAHVFVGKTYNAEAFMAKAVQYAKILVNENQIIHVFNTHLQAWTNERASEIRERQMDQVAEFMNRKLANSDLNSEAVFLAGDFNVDAYEHSQIMRKILKPAGLELVMPSSPQFSFDPSLNPLVGTDDSSEYKTRSKLLGCYDDFLVMGLCSCCPKQLVDGVAVMTNQMTTELVKDTKSKVVQINSQAPFEININMSTRRTIQTVSDHFAVLVQCKIRRQTSLIQPQVGLKNTHPKNQFRSQLHIGWILFEIILFLAFFFLLLSLVYWIERRRKKQW